MRDTWLLEMPSQPRALIDRPPASGHAFYIGLLDDGQQGFLAAPPRFQQAGEVAAFPQLGNVQLHGAHPGIPGAVGVKGGGKTYHWVS